MDYRATGVLDNTELGLDALLRWVTRTGHFRASTASGRTLLDIGYFASVVEIAPGLGLALTTDGVGTKVLVAEMMARYDTIGIDCVAMNVNDVICVGAEPVCMLDYIALGKPTPSLLDEIGAGLHEGARRARISIVGGEISQVREMIKGVSEDGGLDLVGMCIGRVEPEKIIDGRRVQPGDVIIGLASSGIHCNGLTLARRAFTERGRLLIDLSPPELGTTVGEALLEPTRIYVSEVMDLLSRNLPIKALINITGDGLLNLRRIKAEVGFLIDSLPDAPGIFPAIQERGGVDEAEMYRVFNMGIGFCIIASNDRPGIDEIHETVRKHGGRSFEIGRVVEDAERRVVLTQKGLVGVEDRFVRPTAGDRLLSSFPV